MYITLQIHEQTVRTKGGGDSLVFVSENRFLFEKILFFSNIKGWVADGTNFSHVNTDFARRIVTGSFKSTQKDLVEV